MTCIKNEFPPDDLCDMIRNAGMLFDPWRTIFTYGDAIYNPACLDIPDDLIAHEEVHMRQQSNIEGGPQGWWARYLQDPLFRISQEAEAYGRQYSFFCLKKKSRLGQLRMLATLGNILSGPTYGEQITPEGAVKLIREHAIGKKQEMENELCGELCNDKSIHFH